MKRLKLNLDQLGKELEMLDNEHLRGIKGGWDGGYGAYGGYNSWEELWEAMQNGYIPPEGDYNPGGYEGYGDYGWGDYGNYGGYNGGWPGWYPPGGDYGGYGSYGGYNGGGYGGYGAGNPNNCFPSTYESIYNRVYGTSDSGFGELHYNSMYFDMDMGYVYPNPSLSGSDDLVAYNLIKNTFDNVSAYRNINNIYNAGLSESGNTAVFLNLHGGAYADGHSAELYRTETQNGVRKFYIIDHQNSQLSRWYTESEISNYIHSAFVIGEQDGLNQSTDPLHSRQYNYDYNSIYSD